MSRPRFPVPPLRDVIYARGESLLSVSNSCGVPYADLVEVAEGRRLASQEVATAVATHFAIEPVDLFGEAGVCHPGPSRAEHPEPVEHVLAPPSRAAKSYRRPASARRSAGTVIRIDAGTQPAAEVIRAFGMSRREFSDTYGVTFGELVECLRGNRVPHRDTVAILTEATRLPVEKLFTEDVIAHL